MENIFCSDAYEQFFNSLKLDIADVKAMTEHMGQNLHLVADQIHLGRCDSQLNAPASIYSPEQINNSVCIYEAEEGYDLNPYIKDFATNENGCAHYTVYPRPGHRWTPKELDAIDFLLKNMFILGGRSRLMSLVIKASITDTMTGIPNSSGLMQYAGQLYAAGKLADYIGIFMNIKNFKYINKTVGANQGNACIIAFVNLVKASLQEDEMLSRLGGDNFFVLIKQEHKDSFLEYMSHINVTIDIQGISHSYDLSVRMGIYPVRESDTPADMMSGASIALNRAKNAVNQDRIFFSPAMAEQSMHNKEISLLFPTALESNEFVVYYQPKVRLSDDTLCGCEALVRWCRNGSIVPPMDFIPVLEQEGSICALDFYVLEQVCRDIRHWLDENKEPVCISANFSKVHLHNKNLADKIIAIMEKYQIPSQYIEIELTEMSGYEDYASLMDFVNTMHAHGIKTSIDDFGTGYSSLNLLKELNVNIIKLDKSFLNVADKRTSSEEIVIRNIISMINELGMSVIAEGVETYAQAQFLRGVQCDMAQGFLYDKPMPHNEFEKRLANRTYHVS